MVIYESPFLQIEFYEENNSSLVRWSPKTSEMDEATYKTEMMNYLQATLKAKPDKSIVDTRSLNFPISPELQTWTNVTCFPPLLDMGLNKAAFVVSAEFVTQLSVEQTMESADDNPFNTRYFDNFEEAKIWLLS
ncbi:hypothetical protein [uncultured Microscilla sp.]|uniref:hypothetical protein n=1 Tax=uncultured Microscilla sp. TaxID=432653 RepID=UPI0026039B76|nr:hypothetical protein [uncultured Microscilla sp.]